MQTGFPTHPRKNIIRELEWIAENGFDFAEIFLEPDIGDTFDVKEVRNAANYLNLKRIAHTFWKLPIGSESKILRNCAVEMAKNYMEKSMELDCKMMTVHANWPSYLFSEKEGIAFQNESLSILTEYSRELGLQLNYESITTPMDHKENIRKILNANPGLGFHADIGHLNIFGRNPLNYLLAFQDRLHHIHLHDNDGINDLHLPMGAGNIDWKELIGSLKTFYDGSITLEIFSPDKEYALLSKNKLRKLWNSSP